MPKILTTLSLCLLTSFLFGQTISNVSPNAGDRGTMQLPVVISGSGTQFSNATSTVVRIEGAGGSALEVLSVNSVTPQSVSISVRISNLSVLGDYVVSVYDEIIDDMVDLPNGFTVMANNTPPTMAGTTPGKAAVNQILPVTISVNDAHFDQATDNTIYLTQQGTNTVLYPVPGSVTTLNANFIKALFDITDPSISAGSVFNSHAGNSFDGYFDDMASIVITDPTSISGNINYSGLFNGVAELYQENVGSTPNTYSLVASEAVLPGNTYEFTNVAEASYYVRSVPVGMTDIVATYYPSNIAWQNATILTTDPLTPITGADITPVTSLSLGGGVTVNGALGYGPSGFFKIAAAVYAVGLEVFLKDTDNQTYAQTETDQNGEFSFAGVPNGNYEIVVDLPGYTQTSTHSFTIDGSSSDMYGLDLLINEGEIFTSSFLGVDPIEMADLEIFPNPSNGTLNVRIPSNLTNAVISIYNQVGQVVFEEEMTSSNASPLFITDISDLTNGFYIVRVQADQYVSETRLIKE